MKISDKMTQSIATFVRFHCLFIFQPASKIHHFAIVDSVISFARLYSIQTKKNCRWQFFGFFSLCLCKWKYVVNANIKQKKCQMTWSIKMNNHENINIDEITNEEEENK